MATIVVLFLLFNRMMNVISMVDTFGANVTMVTVLGFCPLLVKFLTHGSGNIFSIIRFCCATGISGPAVFSSIGK
jgi:hypothetical protein